MPLSFDPDLSSSANPASTTLTAPVPAGSAGDTLFWFVLSSRDVNSYDDPDLEYAWAANISSPESRYINAFWKVREASESGVTFTFAGSCMSVVCAGNLPPGCGGALSSHNLFIPSTGFDETVTTGPTSRPLAGCVWMEGSGSLDVTPPDDAYTQRADVLDDGVTIEERLTTFVYEPGDTTPSFLYEDSDGDMLRWSMFIGVLQQGRWTLGRVGWSG